LPEKVNTFTNRREAILTRLDKFCMISGALLPTGIVLGNVGFEGVIGLAGMGWLLRLILSAAWGFSDHTRSIKVIVRHPLIMPWLAWYGVIIISFAVNDPFGRQWAYNLAFARHIIFLSAMLDISRRLPVWKFFLAGLAFSLIWALINTLSAHIFGQDLIGNSLSRYTSHLKEDGRIAHLAAYSAPFYFNRRVLSTGLSKAQKWMLVLFFCISTGLVFIAEIRTYMIAMIAGLMLPLLMKKRLWRILVPLGIFFLITGTWLIVHNNEIRGLTTLSHRFYMWQISWQMFRDKPILGVSTAGYKQAFSKYASTDLAAKFNLPDPSRKYWTEGYHAHNLLFMVMAVNGILGLMTFSWLLYHAIRLSISRSACWRVGLYSWPIVFLTIGFVGNNIYDGTILAIFVFNLVLIACTIKPVTIIENRS